MRFPTLRFCSFVIGTLALPFTAASVTAQDVLPFPSPPMNQEWPNANNRGLPTLPDTNGDVVIGNDVWIGYGATILSGVTIGDGAVIGARTVVSRDVEPYSVVVGNSCREIRKRFDEKIIKKLLELKWWDWEIRKIKKNIPLLLTGNVDKFLKENEIK